MFSTDTHFLINPPANTSTAGGGIPDAEDNNLVDPSVCPADIAGNGGKDWGQRQFSDRHLPSINPGSRIFGTQNVAYLVIPAGKTATYSLLFTEISGGGINTLFDFSGTNHRSRPDWGSIKSST